MFAILNILFYTAYIHFRMYIQKSERAFLYTQVQNRGVSTQHKKGRLRAPFRGKVHIRYVGLTSGKFPMTLGFLRYFLSVRRIPQ